MPVCGIIPGQRTTYSATVGAACHGNHRGNHRLPQALPYVRICIPAASFPSPPSPWPLPTLHSAVCPTNVTDLFVTDVTYVPTMFLYVVLSVRFMRTQRHVNPFISRECVEYFTSSVSERYTERVAGAIRLFSSRIMQRTGRLDGLMAARPGDRRWQSGEHADPENRIRGRADPNNAL